MARLLGVHGGNYLPAGCSLTEQAEWKRQQRRYMRMLGTKVQVVRQGHTISLTGANIVALHDAAAKSSSKRTAFMQGDKRIVLTLQAATQLLERLWAQIPQEAHAASS